MKPAARVVSGLFSAAAMLPGIFATGCSSVPKDGEAHFLVSDEEREQHNLYSVFVYSGRLIDLPFLPDPAHNGLFFGGGEDKKYSMGHLSGLAINRKNGSSQRIGNSSNALLVECEQSTFGDTGIISEIFCGTYEDVAQKYLIALDAACFINQQNLRYNLVEPVVRAQNSNSVCYSLLTAMGLELPERHKIMMMPGHGRLLLPREWRSYYEDWTPPVKDRDFLQWYIEKMEDAVRNEFIKSFEVIPPADRPYYFNPDKPFISYTPFVIENAPEQWERVKTHRAAVEKALQELEKKNAETSEKTQPLEPRAQTESVPEPG